MIRNLLRALVIVIGIAPSVVLAGNSVLFSPTVGDLTFPFTPPTTSPAAAGAIDNMIIGATTKRAGSFTTLTADTPVIAADSECASIRTTLATASVFYIAPRAILVTSIRAVFSVAAGGTSTLQVTKDTGTAAPGAGTSLLTSTGFNLNATANTVQTGTLAASAATLTLAAGDRLAITFAQAIQATAGLFVNVCMSPL